MSGNNFVRPVPPVIPPDSFNNKRKRYDVLHMMYLQNNTESLSVPAKAYTNKERVQVL